MRPWSVFGAKSRPGRLQDGKPGQGYSTFGTCLAENVTSRVDFRTPGTHVSIKKSPFSLTPFVLRRPGADLGAIWRRKRSKDAFFSILDGCWSILDQFYMDFRRFSTYVGRVFCQDSGIVKKKTVYTYLLFFMYYVEL